MRTTLSVDDDVLLAARQLAEVTGQSLGQAVSALARKGIGDAEPGGQRNGIELLPVRGGASGATLEEVNRLRDEVP